MKNNAVIHVLSKQSDKKEDAIEVVTPGSFYKKDNFFYAIYDETELSGMEGTTTTLKISSDKFSLIRMGNTIARMDFQKSKENVSLYDTPYGTLELKIKTKDLNINIDENGGDVFIDYNMSIAGQKYQNTVLSIKINTQEA